MRSYTVVGAGAVGLLYGARLAAAGHAVRWVLASQADHVRAHGISVASVEGDVFLAPTDVEVYDDASSVPASEVVLVALKTTANARLDELVAPAVADGATIAMFQNGLGVEDRVHRAVPRAGDVVGAMCFVCARRTGPGAVDHIDYGAVTVGSFLGRPEAATALVDDLVAAGVTATAVDDLATARWRKLVWNIPFNGLSVVLDASTDELLASPPARQLVRDLMDEVIVAATACGARIPASFRDEMLSTTDAMTPYAPSMKLDHDAGRPMEIEAIYDAPLSSASAVGSPMAVVSALRDQLRFLDRRVDPADVRR